MKTQYRHWLSLLVLGALFLSAFNTIPVPHQQSDDASPPEQVVKLIFIHHSTGENWLTDGYGDLGQTLGENNYFVSDTNYGWGPEAIGDRTDIPNWTEWFAGENTPIFMEALFNENEQHSSYTRTLPDPGGENQIIMFKSCFPNSALEGTPDDPPDPDGWLSVGHAKYVYNEILGYFGTRPDKLFIVITAPPLSDSTYSENARAFNEWLLDDWLGENNYTLNNVAVFDFYNVLTGPNAHHRFNNGAVEHMAPGGNTLFYPSDDDHPSVEGSLKATQEFIPMLNVFYHRWVTDAPLQPPPGPAPTTENESQPQALPDLPSSAPSLLDDFERGPLPGTAGWEPFFQDGTDTQMNCALDSSLAHNGTSSLKFEFDVTPNSWATCGMYYDSVQNWSHGQGLSFYLRADRADLHFDVDLYGGDPGGRTTYIYKFAAPSQSVADWVFVQIYWDEILRAEWEENPGAPFNSSEVTGFAMGLGTPETERISGTIWLDDLALMGSEPAVEPSTESEPQPASSNPSICNGLGVLPLILLGVLSLQRRVKRRHLL